MPQQGGYVKGGYIKDGYVKGGYVKGSQRRRRGGGIVETSTAVDPQGHPFAAITKVGGKQGGYQPTQKNLAALRKWKRGQSIGFTMRSSLKAKGLIPRADGTTRVSAKYMRGGNRTKRSKYNKSNKRNKRNTQHAIFQAIPRGVTLQTPYAMSPVFQEKVVGGGWKGLKDF